MMTKKKISIPPVKSTVRTLDVFELLARKPEGLSLSEISRQLGIPVSSLHSILYTLINREYLLQNIVTSMYQLGPKLAQLNLAYYSNVNLIQIVDIYLEEIRRVTKETASLVILQGTTVLFIHKRPGEGFLGVINPVGTCLSAHATGSGKVMLAYLTEGELDKLYPEEELTVYTENTISNKTALKRELGRIRLQGFAYDDQESHYGVSAVAGCIRNRDGRPIAAISIVAPTDRYPQKENLNWHELLKNAADQISLRLGFQNMEQNSILVNNYSSNSIK